MTDDDALISIVIPAHNRPAQLFDAIRSCLDQAYRPLEIIVSDDSPNDDVARMIAALPPCAGVDVRYRHNRPGLGQSGNVNALFAMARGPRLLLLHDDDLLLPGGLDRLDAEWRSFPDPVCVFGKQVVMDEAGAIDADETLAINERYHRTHRPTAVQRPSETVGLLQQIPNNCYLIDTAVARAVGYRPEGEVGLAADADFGIRLSIAARTREFVLIDAYVSAYRVNRVSMMRWLKRNQDHQLMFAIVEGLALPPEVEPARQEFLGRLGPAAVLDAANAGDLALARRIFRSRHYGCSAFGAHGLVARASIASPRLGAMLRPSLKKAIQIVRRWPRPFGRSAGAASEQAHAAERAAVLAVVQDHDVRARDRRAAYARLPRERAAA